ncbi:MAG: sigma-70 family RNA polymerase sigma factor [Marmoricola sp.]
MLPRSKDSIPTWEELVDLHSARVYRLAYRLTGNRHDAEDLTQEVFVRVFQACTPINPARLRLVARITTNLFLDQARRKQRIRFDNLSDEAASLLASKGPGPGDVHMEQLFDADIESALAQLPPTFARAVVLCDVEASV